MSGDFTHLPPSFNHHMFNLEFKGGFQQYGWQLSIIACCLQTLWCLFFHSSSASEELIFML
jgi:hypothetical protein